MTDLTGLVLVTKRRVELMYQFLFSIFLLFHLSFLGRQRRPYIVFRNRFLCRFMFVYIYNIIYIYIYIYMYISVKMAAPCGSLNLLSFHSLCLHLRSHLTNGMYFRICLRNTKPAQSLHRTFSNRNSRKKNIR